MTEQAGFVQGAPNEQVGLAQEASGVIEHLGTAVAPPPAATGATEAAPPPVAEPVATIPPAASPGATVTGINETPVASGNKLVPGADPITGLPAWVPAAVPSVSVEEPVPAGHIKVVYMGRADVARLPNPEDPKNPLRDYLFRPGQPVFVPSEVAEELLTWPRERFELVEE